MINQHSYKQIEVLLVDDHPPLRAGIRALLSQDDEIKVVAEASDGASALEYVAKLKPTVTVLDCELSDSPNPEMDGPEVAAEITKQGFLTNVLALSAFDDEKYVQKMIIAGAKGYLLKSETTEIIIAAVKRVAQGEVFFSASIATKIAAIISNPVEDTLAPTPREQEVLQQLAAGLTNAQIAKKLGVVERTAAYHIENLLNKLSVNNRTKAVVEAIRRGWLEV